MKYEKWIPVLSLAGCYIEVTYFPVLSLAGRYPLMQVRWVDQTQYPMIVVASLSAVPQSCRTPLPNQYLDCMLLAVYTHTQTQTHVLNFGRSSALISFQMTLSLRQEHHHVASCKA